MSNMKVTDVTQMLNASMMAGTDASVQKVSGESDFSTVLDDASRKSSNVATIDSSATVATKQETGRTTVDKSSTKDIKADNSAETNSVENPDTREKVAKDAAKAIKDVAEEIKKTFEVTDEQLEAAMETLGLTMQDLLDPSKLMNLMMEISGVADSISLITDADLYADVKSIIDFAGTQINDLVSENAITIDDLQNVLADNELLSKAIENLKVTDVPTENEEAVLQTESPDNQNGLVNEADLVTTGNQENGTISNINVQVEYEKSTDSEPVDEDEFDTAVNKTSVSDVSSKTDLGQTESFDNIAKADTDPNKGRNQGFEHANRLTKDIVNDLDAAKESASFSQTVTTTTEVNSVGDIVETVTRYSNVDANEIISQITETVKVSFAQDTTSMEMLLHPASLGTVNMQLTAEGGVVSAHILVQDEAVKAAIESQLITLQETFEEQGHKVESVEVSVANYDLNKGGDQNNENNGEKQAKEAFKIAGSRRRINLFGEDAEEDNLEENLSDEEKITRDMMIRNGNTLDYTV